jgi:uncharacterized protein (DUF58 family)
MEGAVFPGWPPAFQEALARLAVAARQPARRHDAGAVRSRVRGRALEFAEHRPYSPGDDPRLVDWRAYSRLDRLYLKQFDEERSRTLTLLVDTSASLDWGEGAAHKGWYARQLAAALAWISLCRHEPVRAFLLSDGGAIPLPPCAGRAGAAALFRALGAVAERGGTGLPAAVRAALAGPVGAGRGPTVLIGDLLDPDWPAALAALAATGEGAVLQTLAPEEWEPLLGDEVELEDVETGEWRPSRLDPAALAAYRARFDTFLAEVREHCRRLGLVHLALDTGIPLRDAVLRLLPEAGVLQ